MTNILWPGQQGMLLLLLVFAAIIMIMSNELVAARQRAKVVYRYLPRDLDTYLREEPLASATFQSMFEEDSVAACAPGAACGPAGPRM